MITLATHNGIFHCDDVMSFAILKLIFDDIKLIRTRDPKVLETADILFDVGGGKFDHHYEGSPVRESGVPYSSAGLIWQAYGGQLIHKLYPELESGFRAEIWNTVDQTVIEHIDAWDNGHGSKDGLSFSAAISSYNGTWKNPTTDKQFWEASAPCQTLLLNKIKSAKDYIDARKVVDASMDLWDKERDPVLILKMFAPWQRTLHELDPEKRIKFVGWKDQDSGEYRIQSVPVTPGARENVVSFPQSWAGLEGAELAIASDVSDSTFCHKGRFIAGAKTLKGVRMLAHKALHVKG